MPYADPTARRRAAREAMRRRRARESGGPLVPLARSVPGGVLPPAHLAALLAEELAAVRNGSKPGGFERARVVVLLVQAALKCYEMSDLTARVEALESAIEARDESGGAYEGTN